MVTWNNLDTLTSYAKLKDLKNHVDIKEAMAGENGAKRVAEYSKNYTTERSSTQENRDLFFII